VADIWISGFHFNHSKNLRFVTESLIVVVFMVEITTLF
jgi:hypothetical protein